MQIRESWQNLSTLKKWAIVALVVCIVEQIVGYVVLPVDGHDAAPHLQWIAFFRDHLSSEHLYPRWIPGGFYGFGAPVFYFYPPLTYYITAAISFITRCTSASSLFYVTASFATLLSILGGYFLCVQLSLTKRHALLGGLIYGFAPYRFLDIFIRNSLSEHLAMGLIPFLFLGMELVLTARCGRRKYVGVVMLALTWAAIIFSNLPAVGVATLAIPAYLLFRISREQLGLIVPIGIGFITGTLLAGVFLVPMLWFYPLLNTSTLLGAGHLDSGNVVVDILNRKSLSVDVYCTLMLSSLILLFGYSQLSRSPALAFKAVLVLLLAMQLPYLFVPLFKSVPPFSVIQATWRCNIFLTLAATALSVSRWSTARPSKALWMILLWFVPAAMLSLLVLLHIQVNSHHLPNYAVTNEEYLPMSSKALLTDSVIALHANDPLVLSSGATMQTLYSSRDEGGMSIETSDTSNDMATFHLFYWPEWRATLDGRSLSLTRDSLGRVMAAIPKGTHRIRLAIDREGDAEFVGKCLSITGILILCLYSLITLLRRRVVN